MKFLGWTLSAALLAGSAAPCPYLESNGDKKTKKLELPFIKETRQLQTNRFVGTADDAIAAAQADILNIINNRPRLGVSINK